MIDVGNISFTNCILVFEDYSHVITLCMHVKSFSMLLFIKFDEAIRKDVKMEAEMKAKFYEKLNMLIENNKGKQLFLK